MRRLGRWLEQLIEMLMAVMMSVMVVVVFVNVVLRYAAGTGFVSSEELARLLFVWLVCLGAILASAENRHLGFDLVQQRLPRKARRACAWITRVLVLYPLLLLVQGAYAQVQVGWNIYSPVMGYPLALSAAAVLVMAVAMLVLLALDALRRDRPVAGEGGPGEGGSAGDDTAHDPLPERQATGERR